MNEIYLVIGFVISLIIFFAILRIFTIDSSLREILKILKEQIKKQGK